MSSIKARLGWGLVASLVVLFALQFVVGRIAMSNMIENQMASRLEHDAESVLWAITLTRDGVYVDPFRIDVMFSRPFSGHYFVAEVRGVRIRSRSLWDEDLPTLHSFPAERFHVTGPQNQELLMVHRNYVIEGGVPVSIWVAEDLEPGIAATRRFHVQLGIIGLLSLLALIALQRWIVVATLRPLNGVRQDVAALERGEAERLREAVPDEVRPLVEEVNRLLAVMVRRMDRSRNALGNLAHSVKTPLTLLSQLAERKELQDCAQVRDILREETGRIGGLVERELKRARLSGVAPPGTRVDLASEVSGLVRAMEALYRDRNLALDVTIPPDAAFPGDREDLLELFGNLLDNACKWARSRVRLQVEEGPGLAFAVEDDGPGCPEETLEKLARRGVRADESAPGHGLGLAIAREVAETYGGTLKLDRSPELGGFRARVAIPLPRLADSGKLAKSGVER